MRGRPSRLVAATAAVLALTACEARSYGTPPSANPAPAPLIVVAPQGPLAPLPEASPDEPASAFNGLQDRTRQATAQAAAKGADITTVVLDRSTGQRVTNGNDRNIAIASVVKLFIADDMLLRGPPLSPDDMEMFQSMLRSSDDSAAQVFWERNGGSAIVTRVADRYGLSGTRPNGLWFNTISTAADLVRYYDMLLSGAGGLPRDKADLIVDNLAQSTPTGIDGMMPGGVYPQRFGIPEGLYAEPVAVKQGWMCCVGSDWMHLSTGIIGSDHRYVMAIASDQPAGADAARATITEAVKTMFPGGRI
ncbi:serine hydrolase [Mycolicibacterium sp. 120270]|uniref:serine hydrolase n=1 Tax=Mycolicibacterium sp. 120270 TaxID=3090600 RepID=UPI00299DE317|nr:serine hydrolase [Mycolicibacterium sp. 120270]MDX1886200.1 serine hydrolase [Mycolicibacterium sp. 120270]